MTQGADRGTRGWWRWWDTAAVTDVRRVLGFVQPRQRRLWGLSIPLAVSVAVLEALSAGAVFLLIRLISEPQSAARVPWLVRVAEAIPGGDPMRRLVLTATVCVAALYVVKNTVAGVWAWVQSRAANESWNALALRLLNGYVSAPWVFHLGRNSAESIHSVNGQTDVAFRMVVAPAVTIVSEVCVVLGIVVVLFATAPAVTLATAAVVVLLFWVALRVTRRASGKWGGREQRAMRGMLQALQQVLGGLKEIRLLGREAFFVERFGAQQAEVVGARHRFGLLLTASRLIIESIFIGGMLLVIALVVMTARTPSTVVPVLGLYAYAGFRIIPSVNRILMHVNSIRYGLPALRHVSADLDRCEAFARALPPAPADGRSVTFHHALALAGVSYVYEGSDVATLRDLTLEIRCGESVGIVGPTGAGKSTLLNVVLGLLTPTSGCVTVDGIDISTMLRAWQQAIGFVPQGVYLVDDTLRRNIALGRADAEIDDARIHEVIRLAQFDAVLRALPAGLDTVVGERGVRLSGGEQQRVAIARALYQEPQLLVFDEATSALDNQTERELTRAIEGLRGTKTMLIVAHRLTTVRQCDRLIFLHHGAIVDIGSFDQLLERNAEFRRLAALPADATASAL
jgi:ABC-type multidrug transport system fused ATPase/permease subunit